MNLTLSLYELTSEECLIKDKILHILKWLLASIDRCTTDIISPYNIHLNRLISVLSKGEEANRQSAM